MSRNMRNRPVVYVRKYGIGSFLLDVTMTFLTGGLWLIWVFVREIRTAR